MDSRNSGLKPIVIFGAMIASLGALNSGFNTSSLNIPGNNVRYCPNVPKGEVTYFPNSPFPQCIPMSDWIWGVATGMFAVGGLLGALLAGPMAEKLGRRDSMWTINISFFIGAILLSLSTSSAQFAIGRIFVGIGSGFMTVVISMYIAETSPPRWRGTLGSLLQLFMTIGIFVIQLIGLGTSSAIGWRIVVMLTIVPTIIQMICLPLCPRSPRWLISHGRIDEARESLLKLRNGDIEEEFADMVIALSKGGNKDDKPAPNANGDSDSAAGFQQNAPAAEPEMEVSLNFFQIMRIPVLAILSIKVMIIHAVSQLTGINAIMYYSTSIFENSFADNARYATVGVGALNMLMTFVALALVDRLGRKMLLTLSAGGMCIFGVLEMIGLLFNVGPLQVVCVLLFVASFAIGLGIIPFIYTAEVYPTYAVSGASSAALTVNWLCNFIIGLIFPTLQNACGPYVFLIFAGIAFLTVFYLIFLIPETKQKSIEDIGRQVGWYNVDPTVVMNQAQKAEILGTAATEKTV
ncbi:general substrate transporter [Halteromyces radiatus]|uniref:general substrate transporter n=1 Tax=Halteromyces radiatus TaxID=101107 RepID=UPI00221EA5D8|nr:general substrate transporter [Halteromyces radiatus]KAI8099683.1 general substrate transporter [Halteromyces radiatus]